MLQIDEYYLEFTNFYINTMQCCGECTIQRRHLLMVLWTSLSKFHEEEIYLNPQLAKIHIVQCENTSKQ